MRIVVVLLVLALARTLPAGAQALRGVVVEAGTATPIEGAMVIVMDAGNHMTARTLTDADGGFLTPLAQAGTYHVRVDRIGYQSLTTDAFDVPEAGLFRRIEVPIHAVELAGLDVAGAKRCEVRADVGLATATVWEEARKALEAAAWTLESGQYRYTLLHFVRYLDRDGHEVLRETRDFSTKPGQVPYVSRPAAALADSGYVRTLAGGRQSYFAPDAEVLLSDEFLNTHCMKLQKGEDGLVGLAFEPVKGRKLPEIRGVLWMDAATATLTRIQFRYTNLDRGPAAGDAGGEVRFGHLSAGTWIVREWHIRMPLLRQIRSGRYLRSGYEEEGGVVWRATDRAGVVVHEAITATVRGNAVDSLGAPISGVTVSALGLEPRAVSDARGAYALGGLPEGHVQVVFGVPFLDTLGLKVRAAPVTLELAEGQSVTLDTVRVPGVDELLGDACGKKHRSGTATLLGRVRAGGAAAAGAAVQLTRLSPTMSGGGFALNRRAAPPGGQGSEPRWAWRGGADDPWLVTTVDGRGIFMFCDVPTPTALRVVAESEGRSADVTVDLPRGRRVVVTTLTLQPKESR